MAKVKDTSYLYASARIRALERTLLTRERMERLLEAPSEEDIRRLLQDCGYAPERLDTSAGIEEMLRRRREDTAALLRAICPEPALVEEEQIPLDYHNLKVYLKAQAQGISGKDLYLQGGRVTPEALESALTQGRLQELPEDLARAYPRGRSLLADTGDPQRMDFALDQACQAAREDAARRSGSSFLQELTRLRADAGNLRILVRAARLDKDPDFLRQALLPGGNLPEARLIEGSTGDLSQLFTGPLAQAAAQGQRAKSGEVALTAFERAVDNAVIAFLRTARRTSFGPAPLAAYLAAREEELKAVRTILTGRLYGVEPPVIRERLRDAYVQ